MIVVLSALAEQPVSPAVIVPRRGARLDEGHAARRSVSRASMRRDTPVGGLIMTFRLWTTLRPVWTI
jgi:hypothetical protein